MFRTRALTTARPAGAPADPDGSVTVYLDNVYDGIARGSWVVLESAATAGTRRSSSS